MKDKKVIGITGGVGSGKSVVMEYLKDKYHAKIILADLVAHDLMQPSEMNYNKIVEIFGTEILSDNQEIDRKKLGYIVFNDPEKLKILNQITHPNVKKEILRRIEAAKQDPAFPIICLEAALLIEAGYREFLDELWYVYVEKEIRIERLKKGRGYTREKCIEIMSNQLSDDIFQKECDRIINNSNDEETTQKYIDSIIGELL